MGTLTPVSLAEAEKKGSRFAADIGAKSLAELRKRPADELLKAKSGDGVARFPVTVDGYFFTKDPVDTFAAGEQAMCLCWSAGTPRSRAIRASLAGRSRRGRTISRSLKKLYGDRADEALKVYAANADADVKQAATDLAGDRFIGYSTWRWADLQGKTGGKPVYRYLFAHPRPSMQGAVHSAEIEYALGNLASNKVYAWTADDYKVSKVMQAYFANFIKAADPNGPGLPKWPAANGGDGVQVMRIDVDSARSGTTSGSLLVPGENLREEASEMRAIRTRAVPRQGGLAACSTSFSLCRMHKLKLMLQAAGLGFPVSVAIPPGARIMKSFTDYLTLNIPSSMAFENITPQVEEAIRKSGVMEGIVLCNSMHITASVFINDDERGLHHDFGVWLEKLAPFNPDPNVYHHNRTGEDNADAHMKRQIMGREVVVAITKGKLDFGPWEQIFYGEFDGGRPKRVLVKIIGE